MSNPVEHGYPGGESLRSLVARVEPIFQQLAERHLGQEIAVVAHRVVNRTYLGHLLGLGDLGATTVPQDNCGLNLIRLRKGRVQPLTINSVLHLL
jgi:alpha-ribazole phosphatase/probable phosphoglycerate mutase